jgi:hypothetical protein
MAGQFSVFSRDGLAPRFRASWVLIGALAFGVVSPSCGGGGATDSNGAAQGQDPFAGIPIPADVDQQLRQMLSELSSLTCERSSRCCSMYGLTPLIDCTQLAVNTLIAPFLGNVGTDDPSNL